MSTKKAKTHLVVTTSKKPNDEAALQARAARFQLTAASTASKSSTPANDDDKLALRAARFSGVRDVHETEAIRKTLKNKPSTTISREDAEKLAKRAERFANIPKEPTKRVVTSKTKIISKPDSKPIVKSSVDSEILNKRAARFANMGAK